MNEPVADTVRGILDGHIVLSRDLAAKNHFPAVDVLHSISRLMPDITNDYHRELAGKAREIIAVYEDARDLISVGAYEKGTNPGWMQPLRFTPGCWNSCASWWMLIASLRRHSGNLKILFAVNRV